LQFARLVRVDDRLDAIPEVELEQNVCVTVTAAGATTAFDRPTLLCS
jgi:hypothetical protein